MEPELIADFDGVPPCNPCQIVRKLGAVDGFEPETLPLHSELSVWGASSKRDVGWPSGIIEQPVAVGPPQSSLPVLVCGQRTSTHEPTVPRNGCVIEQIAANDIVKLLVGVLRRDALEEAVAQIVLVCRRVCRRSAAEHLTTVPDSRPSRPEEARSCLELIRKLVINPEENRPEVSDPGLVAVWIARHVQSDAWSARLCHEGYHSRRHLAPQRIARRNDIACVGIAD